MIDRGLSANIKAQAFFIKRAQEDNDTELEIKLQLGMIDLQERRENAICANVGMPPTSAQRFDNLRDMWRARL